MSSKDIASTLRHADLPSQQRRLRHLRTIAVRNLAITNGTKSGHVSDLETYFTLHTDVQAKAFYTSELIKGSLNPTWRSFSLAHSPTSSSMDLAVKVVVVKVWRGEYGNHSVFLCWHIHLSGLVYLGLKNSLIIGMLDGSYGTPLRSTVSRTHDIDSVVVEQAVVCDSYSIQTLERIQTVLRAIKQTQCSVWKERQAIQNCLAQAQRLKQKEADREMMVMRGNMIRADLNWRMIQLQKVKESYEVKQSASHQKDVGLKTRFETLQKDKKRLHEKKKCYFDVREELIKTGAHLVVKRKRLIAELSYIYPIVEMNDQVHTVCCVCLPNSEDFAGHDDTMIAVALGFTTHLVMMISHFLDVPLRYPMEHRGSRSQIQDLVMSKLTDKERNFPLFSKSQDKFQFSYGVFLLNKNIAQLRYYCGLGTTDLRVTLANIKSLLELRLGAKFDASMSHSQLAALFGHQSIPPHLGGPQKSFGSQNQPEPRLILDNASSPNSSDISSLSSNSDRGGLPRDSKSDPCLKETKNKTDSASSEERNSNVWLQPSSSVASSLSADAIHDQWDTHPPVGTFKTGALASSGRRMHSNYQLSEGASSDSATFRLPGVGDSDGRSEEILVSDS